MLLGRVGALTLPAWQGLGYARGSRGQLLMHVLPLATAALCICCMLCHPIHVCSSTSRPPARAPIPASPPAAGFLLTSAGQRIVSQSFELGVPEELLPAALAAWQVCRAGWVCLCSVVGVVACGVTSAACRWRRRARCCRRCRQDAASAVHQ